MKKTLFLVLFILSLLSDLSSNSIERYQVDESERLLSYVVLNYFKIKNDLYNGKGEHLLSLLHELNLEVTESNIEYFRNLLQSNPERYDFANQIIKEYY